MSFRDRWVQRQYDKSHLQLSRDQLPEGRGWRFVSIICFKSFWRVNRQGRIRKQTQRICMYVFIVFILRTWNSSATASEVAGITGMCPHDRRDEHLEMEQDLEKARIWVRKEHMEWGKEKGSRGLPRAKSKPGKLEIFALWKVHCVKSTLHPPCSPALSLHFLRGCVQQAVFRERWIWTWPPFPYPRP